MLDSIHCMHGLQNATCVDIHVALYKHHSSALQGNLLLKQQRNAVLVLSRIHSQCNICNAALAAQHFLRHATSASSPPSNKHALCLMAVS